MDKKVIIPIAKPIVTKQIVTQVVSVVQSGKWTQGIHVLELEKLLQQKMDARYTCAVSSGTAALHTMLMAYGFSADDEIITSPFTFAATMNAIMLAGAKPVFADIRAVDYTIDPDAIEKKITKRTKAILAVDMYGHPANYKRLRQLANTYKLHLFADAAQSLGALHHGKSQAAYCDAAIFSFYATKNVAAGEGGVIITNDEALARFAKLFRNQGQSGQYQYELPGLNYRMTDIHAVIAVEQLRLAHKIESKRQALAHRYNKGLALIPGVVLPRALPDNLHVFHQYTLRITEDFPLSRDRLREYLLKKGIQAMVYYPQPLHLLKHATHLGYVRGAFPIAEKASAEVLSLPMFQRLTLQEQSFIIKSIRQAAIDGV